MLPPVFRASEALAAGLLTRGRLRTSAYRRLRQDVHAAAHLPLTHRLVARGVALVAPTGSAFGGLTAAVLWGARDLAGPHDPVEVVLPPGVRWHPGPGATVRSTDLAADVVTDGELRWTSRARTALDLVRRGPLDDAVVLLDRLVQADVVALVERIAAVLAA